MAGSVHRVGAVALGIALALALAAPAGAVPPRSDPIYGRFHLGIESPWTVDGVCRHNEANQVFFLNRFESNKDVEAVGLSVCWQNSSAEGGDSVDRGTFRISDRRGWLKGTVSGSYSSGSGDFAFRLAVVHGTEFFRGTSGTLLLHGCPRRGTDKLVAQLVKFDPANPYPPLPKPCT